MSFQDAANFRPTPESIPPPHVSYQQKSTAGTPVNHHPLNPFTFVLRAASIYPDKLAIVHPDVNQPVFYSYSVWAQRIQNLAYALIQAGICPGDRVAVLAPNSPMIADAHFGILAARAILTPINTRLTSPEIAYIIEHSGSKLILVDQECSHLIRDSSLPTIVCHDTGTTADPYEKFLSMGRRFSSERSWAGLDVEPNEDAGAVLCYTSGTTGRAKGVLTTLRGSYLAAIGNAVEAQINRDSTYLWVLPMFHAAGWTFPWANVFACATQVLDLSVLALSSLSRRGLFIQITIRSVNYPVIWKHLINSGVTHYCGAPTVQIGIVNDAASRPLSRPVSAIIAGSAPTAQVIGQLEQIGIKPVHVYGLTETHFDLQTYGPFTRCYDQPFWATLDLAERAKLMACQGQSFATAQSVRVVFPPRHENDQNLVDVPRDGKTVGEIVTRGNIVMKEYFRDPEATRKAFRGGYFNSGDLAVIHPGGVLQIMDRSKDIIISGGENASSLAIEQELASHPHVLEVSVVARPHSKWGERPMAFVILRPEYASKWTGNHDAFTVELKRHARTLLPGFACPEWVQIVDELPKTSTGKILKTDLRKIVAKL
ncbi:acetyl-CoA synthetase-like protein [Phlebopus sp. FC_14]|nr:acetyl-CoA synthetase-like protein [Phlebopus sp. FC_14]